MLRSGGAGPDRRVGDRRAGDTAPEAAAGVRLMIDDAPDTAAILAGLKSVRAKLAAALER